MLHTMVDARPFANTPTNMLSSVRVSETNGNKWQRRRLIIQTVADDMFEMDKFPGVCWIEEKEGEK